MNINLRHGGSEEGATFKGAQAAELMPWVAGVAREPEVNQTLARIRPRREYDWYTGRSKIWVQILP